MTKIIIKLHVEIFHMRTNILENFLRMLQIILSMIFIPKRYWMLVVQWDILLRLCATEE